MKRGVVGSTPAVGSMGPRSHLPKGNLAVPDMLINPLASPNLCSTGLRLSISCSKKDQTFIDQQWTLNFLHLDLLSHQPLKIGLITHIFVYKEIAILEGVRNLPRVTQLVSGKAWN